MSSVEREPDNIRGARTYRDEAARRRPGPNRDALNRLADELEAAGDDGRLPKGVLSAGLIAYGSDDDYLEEHMPLHLNETPEPAPDHIGMPPIIRRSAARHQPGPNRDALLRFADELEDTGDVLLVSRNTLSAGLAALASATDAEA